jgi:hypothetical protein
MELSVPGSRRRASSRASSITANTSSGSAWASSRGESPRESTVWLELALLEERPHLASEFRFEQLRRPARGSAPLLPEGSGSRAQPCRGVCLPAQCVRRHCGDTTLSRAQSMSPNAVGAKRACSPFSRRMPTNECSATPMQRELGRRGVSSWIRIASRTFRSTSTKGLIARRSAPAMQ